MACRNLEKAKSAEKDIKHETKGLLNVGEIVVKKLNLASFKSIRKCADDILASEKHIHFLVNNAGKINFIHDGLSQLMVFTVYLSKNDVTKT